MARHNPREIYAQITQPQYLQAMTDAVGIILKSIAPNIENISINALRAERYYALQNILEGIATLGNPNALGATQRINDQSRRAIFSIERQADRWLRGLGQSRVDALHVRGTIVIPDDEVHTHLEHLQLLHRVLVNPALEHTSVGKKLEDKFGASVPAGTPPTVDKSSSCR